MRTFNLMSASRICEALGARIKRARLAQNLTQQQLAHMTQTSLSSVRRLEAQGQGSLESVVRVALALQLVEPFEALFDQTPSSIAELERAQALRQRARIRRSTVTVANVNAKTSAKVGAKVAAKANVLQVKSA